MKALIDFRIKTFLTLCDTMNYTKTAEKLCITQPAVTQHIKYLEEIYGGKLFDYKGKILSKTKKGYTLELYARSMVHNSDNIKKEIISMDKAGILKIGATKTISQFVLKNKIDIALIEGIFDKGKYGYKLFKKETFVGICPKNHSFAGKEVNIKDLFRENLIVREKGSGTRNIFELFLKEKNYSLYNFKRITEISDSLSLIIWVFPLYIFRL